MWTCQRPFHESLKPGVSGKPQTIDTVCLPSLSILPIECNLKHKGWLHWMLQYFDPIERLCFLCVDADRILISNTPPHSTWHVPLCSSPQHPSNAKLQPLQKLLVFCSLAWMLDAAFSFVANSSPQSHLSFLCPYQSTQILFMRGSDVVSYSYFIFLGRFLCVTMQRSATRHAKSAGQGVVVGDMIG